VEKVLVLSNTRLSAQRRRGFSPELPRAAGSRPNSNDFLFLMFSKIRTFFFLPATITFYFYIIKGGAEGRIFPKNEWKLEKEKQRVG